MRLRTPNIISLIMLMIIVTFVISSCKKKVITYEIQGKVYDPQLNTLISDANISLKASKVVSGVYNPNYIEIQTTKTNSNGIFNFSVEHDNAAGYRLDITKKDYFDESVDIKADDLNTDQSYSVNIDFIPVAYIKLNVKNTSPQGTDDEISFHFKNVDVKCKDCWDNTPIVGTGPTYNYSRKAKVSGEKQLILEWVVTKKGNQHIFHDTIQSKAFKSTTYNIDY